MLKVGSELDLTTSVIVATKDRFENVLSCLESVMKQSVLPETFIVVDASEKDGLQTQLKNKLADSSIELIYIKAEPGLTRQRNLGIKANRNELVLFLDDDVVLDKKYLEQMKRIFSEDKKRKIGGATGFITNTSDYNKFSKFIRKLFCLAEIKKGEVKKSWANCGVASEIKEKTEVQWLSGNADFEVAKKRKTKNVYAKLLLSFQEKFASKILLSFLSLKCLC
ncbi:MAG: hypothetical protein B6D62_04700 [Candidatus Cloacimonas sp. 4484_275]|nr:MAG: hypothetical protein B6D62_04700 [Candidatus Cloacimonas sp. 4484_275]